MDIQSFAEQDFSSICRTCLQSEMDLLPIYESRAADMLIDCNFCVIEENDVYPTKICNLCFEMLEKSYKFKNQCQNSQLILNKLLLSTSNISNNSTYAVIKPNNNSTIIECSNEETSIDSIDLRNYMVLGKNEEFVVANNFASNSTNPHEISNHGQENNLTLDDKDESEGTDLTSFLEKSLPPPLPHSCEKCDNSFNSKKDLEIHYSLHNNDLTCLACSKKCQNRQILKRHLKIHLIAKPHVCKICSKDFAESHALTKHLRRHSGVPREKKHFCPDCGQGFSEPYYLKVHLRKHTGERPLLCTVCNKSFADPRSLKIHQMIHSGEKPHKCSFCLKSFIQRANLTKHERTHTGERPYICKLCGKQFSQSSSLLKHHRTHTGEKLYTCEKCNKRFSEKSGLCNHMKIHEENNPTYLLQTRT